MEAKDAAKAEVDRARDALVELSHTVHAHPELAFEEERSSAWAADALAGGDFDVDFGVCDLPTAFVATAGSGPLTIGICAEYDALPAIGHACGHNIICAAAVGAGLALAPLADDLGLTVKVFGTPAEEGGGGKILMLERGAFNGVHASMMVHPAPTEMDAMPCLAVSHLDVHYTGKEAHASAFPEQGINAADALVVAQTAIGLLRQHIRSTDRIHGIVTKGGDAPNIVPAETSASYMVRAESLEQLEQIYTRVRRCFEAGSIATGAALDIEGGDRPYAQVRQDPDLAALYQRNAEALGRQFSPASEPQQGMASTDMGNVSLAIPSV